MPTLPSNKKSNSPHSLEARVGTTFAIARAKSAKLVEEVDAHINLVETTLARIKEQHKKIAPTYRRDSKLMKRRSKPCVQRTLRCSMTSFTSAYKV
jgi:hypothetical protein